MMQLAIFPSFLKNAVLHIWHGDSGVYALWCIQDHLIALDQQLEEIR